MLDGMQNDERITATEIKEGRTIHTVDITPTWTSLVGVMLLVHSTTEHAATKADMETEFRRMAEAADKYNEMQASNAEAIAKVQS